VFAFEWRATCSSALRAKLILAPFGMPKMSLILNEPI
jgi:hypothetical protein